MPASLFKASPELPAQQQALRRLVLDAAPPAGELKLEAQSGVGG